VKWLAYWKAESWLLLARLLLVRTRRLTARADRYALLAERTALRAEKARAGGSDKEVLRSSGGNDVEGRDKVRVCSD
jgi:hypothetical protein